LLKKADMGKHNKIMASKNTFSLVPTTEIIFLPIACATPVSNSVLPTTIMPVIRKNMSLEKPEKARLNGITPKITSAIQASIDVVAIWNKSVINKISSIPNITNATIASVPNVLQSFRK